MRITAMIWILSKHDESEYENSRLIEEFKAKNINVSIVSPKNFDLIINENSKVLYKGIEVNPKLILVRTGSGTDFFTSCVLKQFQFQNIKCINSPESIELAKDKLLAAQRLTVDHIATPKTILVRFPVDIDLIKNEIGFPCILKILSGSYGRGVHLCRTEEEFKSFIQFIEALDPKKTLIVQKFMKDKIGTDLRVWVINGKVIGAMQRTSGNADFRANISNGGYGLPYELNDRIIHLSKSAAESIGLDIAGVDLLFDDEGFVVCEVNSAPGFAGMENFCGINIAEKIVDYVLALL
jgi:RimK family alpha-L-glutamate ligase